MKHLFFLILVLVVFSGFSFPSGAVIHGPLLKIDATHSDFGAVPDTGFALRTFTLSNGGDSTLNILRVQPSCGCTVALLTDSILAPGKSTVLQVRLSAAGKSGAFYKDIHISSNSRDGASWLKFYGHFVAAPDSARASTTAQHLVKQ